MNRTSPLISFLLFTFVSMGVVITLQGSFSNFLNNLSSCMLGGYFVLY